LDEEIGCLPKFCLTTKKGAHLLSDKICAFNLRCLGGNGPFYTCFIPVRVHSNAYCPNIHSNRNFFYLRNAWHKQASREWQRVRFEGEIWGSVRAFPPSLRSVFFSSVVWKGGKVVLYKNESKSCIASPHAYRWPDLN